MAPRTKGEEFLLLFIKNQVNLVFKVLKEKFPSSSVCTTYHEKTTFIVGAFQSFLSNNPNLSEKQKKAFNSSISTFKPFITVFKEAGI